MKLQEKEGGTRLHKTFKEINLVFKGLKGMLEGKSYIAVSSFWLLHAGLMIPGANIRSEWWLPIHGELEAVECKASAGWDNPTTAADKNSSPTAVCCMGKIPPDPPGPGIYTVH